VFLLYQTAEWEVRNDDVFVDLSEFVLGWMAGAVLVGGE